MLREEKHKSHLVGLRDNNLVLVDMKRFANSIECRLLNALNILPYKIQKLFLGEAGCVERLKNLLLSLLILSFDVFEDKIVHLNRGGCICANHPLANISRIFLERNNSQIVDEKLEEMISCGQVQILCSHQAQETFGSGELLESDLLLGEILDLGRLWQEEDQPQQIFEVEERGERQILQKHIFRKLELTFIKMT